MKILDGLATAREIFHELHKTLKGVQRQPGLAFILVGEHPASLAYVTSKKKRCAEVGIRSFDFELEKSISEKELLRLIAELNSDPLVDGILVQLPLPDHIEKESVLLAIDPNKDVDGFHPLNMGKLLLGRHDGFTPCTPAGIVEILKRNHLSCDGKEAVIVGRSNIVGKPLGALLMQNREGLNATVTIAHSKSPHLEAICKRADILIAAVGRPSTITKTMVKPGAIVIDVGINRLSDGTIVGDVDFEDVSKIASHITPVPGGVGPMTIAMLLQNTWLSYVRKATP